MPAVSEIQELHRLGKEGTVKLYDGCGVEVELREVGRKDAVDHGGEGGHTCEIEVSVLGVPTDALVVGEDLGEEAVKGISVKWGTRRGGSRCLEKSSRSVGARRGVQWCVERNEEESERG